MPAVPSTSTYNPQLLATYPIRRSAKACERCRRSKSRCDGPEAWPCRRCRESGIECVFEDVGGDSSGSAPPSSAGKGTTKGSSTHAPRKLSSPAPANPFPSSSTTSTTHSSPNFSLEQRLQRLEAELAAVRKVTDLHSARLQMVPNQPLSSQLAATATVSAKTESPGSDVDEEDGTTTGMSLNDPEVERIAKEAFNAFWLEFAPYAPYMSPTNDTFSSLLTRSPLLLFAILAVTSRFHSDTRFMKWTEEEALRLMRNTLYNPDPPSLDDLKGTVIFNSWLSRGAPPGHSLSLAFQLDLPRKLEILLDAVPLAPEEGAKVFEELMPSVRTWLTLYTQDLWLSVATGRRSMVSLDFSTNAARNLLTFPALRPVDARIIAQCELVNILSGVQDVFLKTQKHSVADTVRTVVNASGHLDVWMQTWESWAKRQEEATTAYMLASFAMQLQAGKFYINTLGLRDITAPEEVTAVQLPVVRASILAATEIQFVAAEYGLMRISRATEFTLISISSAALFLLKMIKLLPSAVPSIQRALSAIRGAAHLLSGAPVKQYHRAVVGALYHLESTLELNIPALEMTREDLGEVGGASASMGGFGGDTPTNGFDPNAMTGLTGSNSTSASQDPLLFSPSTTTNNNIGNNPLLSDPEMELAISSVLQSDDFWSWGQTLPADNFASVLVS